MSRVSPSFSVACVQVAYVAEPNGPNCASFLTPDHFLPITSVSRRNHSQELELLVRKNIKKTSATFLGFSMLLAACSGTGDAPDALAFQDDSGGTGAATVARPTGNPCASNEFSVGFDASVVLIDPTTTTAGPFAVNVPAGTYDIIVSTWLGPEDIAAQTMEQWFFTTDSGYQSPLTNDFSPELLQNQEFQGQTIGATTSVTLHHKAPGMTSANSVHPLCIGFRTVEAPETTTTTAAPVETTAAPVETTEAPVETTEAPVETTEAPVETTEAPVETTEAPVETTEAPAETTPTTEAAAEGTEAVAAQADETTTTVREDPTDAPELALTGPSELATSLGLTGAALLLAGSAAVVAARRSDDE